MKSKVHRRRKERYDLAISELRKVFLNFSQEEIFREIRSGKEEIPFLQRLRIRKAWKQLQKSLLSGYGNERKNYRYFLRSLRKLLFFYRFEEPNTRQGKKLIEDLCRIRFHRVSFFSYGMQLLEELLSSCETEEFPAHCEHIDRSAPLIYPETGWRKLNENIFKWTFDPQKYNHPYLLYTLSFRKDNRSVRMIRMSCPTYENRYRKPRVVPEFREFLLLLQRENGSHLYINKQKTWGEEGARTDALLELEKENDRFFCVCLPSDGDFYHQKKEYQNISETKEFLETFYEMLVGIKNRGYYHLPRKWIAESSFRSGVKETLQETLDLFFENRKNLSARERRHFIDHAYTLLILFFIRYSSVDSMNITCRDGIDRAACEQTKLLYYLQIASGTEKEEGSRKERLFVLHLSAYLAKNRAVVKERREFLAEVLKGYRPEVLEKIRGRYQDEPLLRNKPTFFQ